MRSTRTILAVALGVGLVAMLASTAWSQRPVNLRVNLSTQPVYSRFDRRPIRLNYLRATQMLSTGNIRGGRALMINRNFLEDRYFSGSLTRFFRDTTSVQDVLSGGHYGPGVPYFQPGSLTSSAATFRQSRTHGADPFGSVPTSFGRAGSPFHITYSVPVRQGMYYRAQFPAQENLGSIRSAFTAESLGNLGIVTPTEQPAQSQARFVSERSPFAGPKPWWQLSGLAGLNEKATPEDDSRLSLGISPTLTGQGEPAPAADKSLQWYLFKPPGETEQQGRPTPEPQAPKAYGLGLREPAGPTAEGEGETPEPGFLFPGKANEILLAPNRSRRLDEQYYQLALLDLAAGAYRQAAEAFNRSARYNLQRSWQAGRHEAWAWLLSRQFYLAGYLLKRTILEKPDKVNPQFRLTSVVDRPGDWQAVEKELQKTLTENPNNSTHAFVLAYLKIFSGRSQEAEPYLKVAEKESQYAEAVKLLRAKALQ